MDVTLRRNSNNRLRHGACELEERRNPGSRRPKIFQAVKLRVLLRASPSYQPKSLISSLSPTCSLSEHGSTPPAAYLIQRLVMRGVGIWRENNVAGIDVTDLYVMLEGYLVNRLSLPTCNTKRLACRCEQERGLVRQTKQPTNHAASVTHAVRHTRPCTPDYQRLSAEPAAAARHILSSWNGANTNASSSLGNPAADNGVQYTSSTFWLERWATLELASMSALVRPFKCK